MPLDDLRHRFLSRQLLDVISKTAGIPQTYFWAFPHGGRADRVLESIRRADMLAGHTVSHALELLIDYLESWSPCPACNYEQCRCDRDETRDSMESLGLDSR